MKDTQSPLALNELLAGGLASIQPLPFPQYRYRLTSTGYSSSRYGNCAVCDKHTSEVFIQIEERFYTIASIGHSGWTQNGCFTLFGHQECLESKQRAR